MKHLLLYPLFISSFFLKLSAKECVGFQIMQNYKQKSDTSNFTVIHFNKAIHHMFDKALKNVNLSDVDIQSIQLLVEKSVIEYNLSAVDTFAKKVNDPFIDLATYKMQLIAVTNKNGEKEVFVNCICSEDIPSLSKSGLNWRKEIFKVNDGGKCYFHLFINLTTKQYYNFRVNGNA